MSKPKVIELEPAPGDDPNDDSDSALWRAFKHHNHKRKESNLVKAEQSELANMMVHHTQYHWSMQLVGKHLDYWPSKNKFQYDGRIHNTDIQGLLNFIARRSK